MALVGQKVAQVPHPLHSASLTSAITALSLSCKVMAPYSHTSTHVPQPRQSSWLITEVSGSIKIVERASKASTLAATALAWPMESEISFGPWIQPQIYTPSIFVSIGPNLGCF